MPHWGESQKFQTLKCLKTKFEANETTQGNAFIIDLSSFFLGLKICVCVCVFVCVDETPEPPG